MAWGFVVAGVTARCGDAPPAPPTDEQHKKRSAFANSPRPKSLATAPRIIFRHALREMEKHKGKANYTQNIHGVLRTRVQGSRFEV